MKPKVEWAKIRYFVKSNAALAAKKFERIAPSLLIGGGCLGVGYSAWKACKATEKAKEVANDFVEEREQIEQYLSLDKEEHTKAIVNLYKKEGLELIKIYWKPVTIGLISVTMVFFGHGKLKKEILTLSATAATIDNLFNDYRQNVVEKYGEQEDLNLLHGTHLETVDTIVTDKNGKEKVTKTKAKTVDIPENSIYSRIFDESSREYINDENHNEFYLTQTNIWANNVLGAQGFLFLNDVLDRLGFKKCAEGAVVGWIFNPEEENKISFNLEKAYLVKPGMKPKFYYVITFNIDGVIYDKLPEFSDI